MKTAVVAVFSALIICCTAAGLRPSYAGIYPIGYPMLMTTTTTADPLSNRFGGNIPTTTMRLPIEVGGDAELYKQLLKLPVDKQPFWLLNWQALEAHRSNPQTYDTRPNEFVDVNVKS